MPIVLIVVGIVILVAAIRNTAGDLGNALATDVPPFLVWAGALIAVGALGYVPGLRTTSRGLLALVLLVLLLVNYKKLFAGLSNVAPVQVGQPAVDPATAYALNPNARTTTAASVSGTSSGGSTGGVATAQTGSGLGAFDPQGFLSMFGGGNAGFGGVA